MMWSNSVPLFPTDRKCTDCAIGRASTVVRAGHCGNGRRSSSRSNCPTCLSRFVLEAPQPGRTLAFRLLANPTKRLRPKDQNAPDRQGGRRDNRYPILKPEDQIAWLINQGNRHGFTIPGIDTHPDVALTPSPRLTGRQTGKRTNQLTIDPVRYDGHLVVTDPDALTTALTTGIGPAKPYGCGLLSLATPRRG